MFDEHDDAIRTMLRRVKLIDSDDGGTQHRLRVSGMKSEELKNIVHSQPHGFFARPPAGAEGLLLALGGRSDRAHALNLEHPDNRPKGLPPGAAAIYNDQGHVLKILPAKAEWDHKDKNHHEHHIDKRKIEATGWIWQACGAIYLGPGPWYPVMTSAGPSQCVYASIAPAAPATPTPNTI